VPLKNKKERKKRIPSWSRWYAPIVPAIQDAEARRSLEASLKFYLKKEKKDFLFYGSINEFT
jgi:hypothetical protein